MKFLNLAFACVLLLSTNRAFADGPSKPASSEADAPRVVVTPTTTDFWFPVKNAHGIWTWGDTDRNVCKYSWIVKVPTEASQYKLGYKMFTALPGRKTGTFSDLLASGQTDLWQYNPNGLSLTLVERVRYLRARVQDGGLVLELTDSDWIKRLFDSKPKSLEFEIGGIRQEQKVLSVPVQYLEASQGGGNTK